METIKYFFLAVIGTLGTFQIIDPVVEPMNDPTSVEPLPLIIKGLVSIIGGLLTALLSKWYKNYKSKDKDKK